MLIINLDEEEVLKFVQEIKEGKVHQIELSG